MTQKPWCSEARLAQVNAAATRKREYIEQLWATIAEYDRRIRVQALEIQRLQATLNKLRARSKG